MGERIRKHTGPSRPVILLATAAALVSYSLACFAATQGTVGSSSTARLNISLKVDPQVQVSGLRDIHLIVHPKAAKGAQLSAAETTNLNQQRETRFCVYSRSGQYQLQVGGDGTNQQFAATSAHHVLPLDVAFDDGRGWQTLAYGRPLAYQLGADRLSPRCANTGLNSSLRVTPVLDRNPPPGTYTGTLTLLVAPE